MKTAILTLIGITLLTSCQSEVEKLQENITYEQQVVDSLWARYEEYNHISNMSMDSVTYGLGDTDYLLSRVEVLEDTKENLLELIGAKQQHIKDLNEEIHKIELGLK
jgi:chromosome segregation ATPase